MPKNSRLLPEPVLNLILAHALKKDVTFDEHEMRNLRKQETSIFETSETYSNEFWEGMIERDFGPEYAYITRDNAVTAKQAYFELFDISMRERQLFALKTKYTGYFEGFSSDDATDAITHIVNHANRGDNPIPLLLHAVYAGYMEVVKALMDAGADIRYADDVNGDYVLMGLRGLLEPDSPYNQKQDPLSAHEDMLKMMVEHGLTEQSRLRAIAYIAEHSHNPLGCAYIWPLLRARPSLCAHEDVTLIFSRHVGKGNELWVKEMLKAGVRLPSPHAIHIFFENGSEVEEHVTRKIITWILRTHPHFINVEHLSFKRSPSEFSGTLLMMAVNTRKLANVMAVLACKPAIDQANYEGKTALMRAAEKRCDDIVAALLKEGANPRLKDRLGKTALMCASTPHALKLLMIKSDIDAQDNEGKTALMWAIKEMNSSKLDALIFSGASVLIKDKAGCTALKCALYGWDLVRISNVLRSLLYGLLTSCVASGLNSILEQVKESECIILNRLIESGIESEPAVKIAAQISQESFSDSSQLLTLWSVAHMLLREHHDKQGKALAHAHILKAMGTADFDHPKTAFGVFIYLKRSMVKGLQEVIDQHVYDPQNSQSVLMLSQPPFSVRSRSPLSSSRLPFTYANGKI